MADTKKPEELPRRGPGRPPLAVVPPKPAPRMRGDANAVVRELGGRTVQVKLYRRDGMDWAYLDTVDGADLTLDVVKEAYGAGKYQVRWEDDDGSEREKEFSIARRAEEQTGVRTTTDALLLKVIEKLDSRPARDDSWMRELLMTQLRQPAAQPVRDPLMETLVTALVGRSNQPGQSMDMLAVLKLVEEARQSGVSLAEKLAALGTGDSTAAVLGTIREVGAPLASAVADRMRADNAGRRRVNAPPPAAVAAITAGAETVKTDAPLPKWLTDIRPYVSFVVDWAKKDTDAETVARRVLDVLDNDQFTEFGETLTGHDDDQLVQLLETGMPQLVPYPGWLRRVVVELRTMHAEASEDESAEAGESQELIDAARAASRRGAATPPAPEGKQDGRKRRAGPAEGEAGREG